MFTGIVTDVATVRRVAAADGGRETRLELATAWDTASIAIGASVSCAGCCLTVVEKGPGRLAFDVSAETLSRTTLGAWRAGARVNLERSLRLGDELGGHLVLGHVDAVARIVDVRPEQGSARIECELDGPLGRFIAPKGAVALDGVSLTVNEVGAGPAGATRFGVNLIPHTRAATTFGTAAAGDLVNLEVDPLARYVARMHEFDAGRRG